MRRLSSPFSATATGLALSACGQTIDQRAATGAIAGAVVAGPVGAAVGGAASPTDPEPCVNACGSASL